MAAVKFLIVAIFCNGAVCEPVRFVAVPWGSEVADDWCKRHALGKAMRLAEGYLPRVELTVQPGSVHCEVAE